jgi:adenylate cyclase
LEVDQTLRLARDQVERVIARYRLYLFAAATGITALTRAFGLNVSWVPTVTFAAASLYATIILVYLRRYGNPPLLAAIGLILDLVTTATAFVAAKYVGPEDASAIPFTTHILGPMLVLTLLINSLRASKTLAIVGTVITLALYVPVVVYMAGFHPAEISVFAILGLAGLIGVASAAQARKNLDNLARLQLLRRYLPPEAVLRVMREDPDAALAPGGRLVTVTLLSADLRGFTAMSEDLSPSEVMAQLNGYHGAMIDVIERHGGAIDKFIGDGTLVVFGLAGAPEEAAAAAVACAQGMLQALLVHNEERAARGSPLLAMGIAVHTGPVIAGNLGVPGRRLEFTVIGDTVNTVSRLEGETKTAGTPVIISAETVALLVNAEGLRELTPVTLRGKSQATRVYGLAGR